MGVLGVTLIILGCLFDSFSNYPIVPKPNHVWYGFLVTILIVICLAAFLELVIYCAYKAKMGREYEEVEFLISPVEATPLLQSPANVVRYDGSSAISLGISRTKTSGDLKSPEHDRPGSSGLQIQNTISGPVKIDDEPSCVGEQGLSGDGVDIPGPSEYTRSKTFP